jgi:hypothetical protein
MSRPRVFAAAAAGAALFLLLSPFKGRDDLI